MEFNYIPNQKKKKSPKEIISNVKEMPKNMIEKIKKTVEEMKKKGQKLTPELKKLLTKALAGSLVAGMLFMNMVGCDLLNNPYQPDQQITSMSQLFPEDLANQMENSVDYNVEQYNAKKAEFLAAEDISGFFDELPTKYYEDKFDKTKEFIHDHTVVLTWFVDDSNNLYIAAYYLTAEMCNEGEEYKRKIKNGDYSFLPQTDVETRGYVTSSNYEGITTLFKFENIDSSIIDSLIKCDENSGNDNQYILDNYWRGNLGADEYNFDVAWLLDWIVNNCSYKVIAESHGLANEDVGSWTSWFRHNLKPVNRIYFRDLNVIFPAYENGTCYIYGLINSNLDTGLYRSVMTQDTVTQNDWRELDNGNVEFYDYKIINRFFDKDGVLVPLWFWNADRDYGYGTTMSRICGIKHISSNKTKDIYGYIDYMARRLETYIGLDYEKADDYDSDSMLFVWTEYGRGKGKSAEWFGSSIKYNIK